MPMFRNAFPLELCNYFEDDVIFAVYKEKVTLERESVLTKGTEPEFLNFKEPKNRFQETKIRQCSQYRNFKQSIGTE